MCDSLFVFFFFAEISSQTVKEKCVNMPFLHIAFKLSLSCSKQGKNVTDEHLCVCFFVGEKRKSVRQCVGPKRP